MPTWRPGELDQRVTIKRETDAPDDMGGQTVTLSDLPTVWAKVMPLRGNEREFADRVEPTGKYLFVMRYRPDIVLLENDRLSWNGSEYNVGFIATTGTRELYFEVTAQRGVAQ